MKRIYSSLSVPDIYILKGLLESEGIGAIVVGEHRGIASGLTPPTDAWIEIHIEEKDVERATQILSNFKDGSQSEEQSWKCEICGETIPSTFDDCWNCSIGEVENKIMTNDAKIFLAIMRGLGFITLLRGLDFAITIVRELIHPNYIINYGESIADYVIAGLLYILAGVILIKSAEVITDMFYEREKV